MLETTVATKDIIDRYKLRNTGIFEADARVYCFRNYRLIQFISKERSENYERKG